LGKRYAVNATDPTGQVTLIGKAPACCNLCEAGSPVTYQCCCALQPKRHDVTVRRYANDSGEYQSEVKWTATCYARKGRDFDRFIQMSNDVVRDPSEHLLVKLPRGGPLNLEVWRATRPSRNLLATPLQ
jgi:hypothetical protein